MLRRGESCNAIALTLSKSMSPASNRMPTLRPKCDIGKALLGVERTNRSYHQRLEDKKGAEGPGWAYR